MILLVDNYDSFTYNLKDYLLQLGQEVEVKRNDEPLDTFHQNYDAVVLSPGPGIPQKSNNLLSIIKVYENHPLLGICLGHQALAVHFGLKLKKAIQPIHGKIRPVIHNGDELYNDIPEKFNVVRYHSLVIDKLSNPLIVNSWSESQEIMGFRHIEKLIFGIQYHPESILTEYGFQLLRNWLSICKI